MSQTPATAGPTTMGKLRGGAGWFVIPAMATLLVVLTAALLSPPKDDPLSATSTTSDGARALARVLANSEGVDIVTVSTAEDVRRLRIGAETTVFLPRADELTTSLAGVVERSTRDAGRFVLLSPSQPVLDRLAIPLKQRAGLPITITADCQADDVAGQDSLASADVSYALRENTAAATCFPSTSFFDDDAEASHAYVALPATTTRPETVVLGAQRAVANRGITKESHAGIAVRMLRHTDRVVWIMPDPQDQAAPLRMDTPVPEWFLPAIVILMSSGVGLCLWRGRRLGRIVPEPLPVVVHAIETTAARGRLYRASGDAASALRLLQDDTVDVLRRQLDLHPASDRGAVAEMTARRLGRDVEEVRSLLTTRDTLNESELVARATQLRRLRHEAHE